MKVPVVLIQTAPVIYPKFFAKVFAHVLKTALAGGEVALARLLGLIVIMILVYV